MEPNERVFLPPARRLATPEEELAALATATAVLDDLRQSPRTFPAMVDRISTVNARFGL
jgi:hypothetical protein